MMKDLHNIVLTYPDGTHTTIKVEGIEMAKYISTLMLHRRKNEYKSIAVYNRNGDLVSTPYKYRERV